VKRSASRASTRCASTPLLPAGEVTGHLLGFTNVDDVRQEGLELAFDQWLGGEPARGVMRDQLGRTIEDIERIRAPRPGQDSSPASTCACIPRLPRTQGRPGRRTTARSGSVVVLDVQTGEVLAMVSQPAFNPNDREQYAASRYRTARPRFFEPGRASSRSSTPRFESAATTRHADRDRPGMMRVGSKTVKDKHNLGTIDVTTALAKSSTSPW